MDEVKNDNREVLKVPVPRGDEILFPLASTTETDWRKVVERRLKS